MNIHRYIALTHQSTVASRSRSCAIASASAIACAVAALSILAMPAMAQTSNSIVYGYDYGISSYPCQDGPHYSSAASSANCSGAFANWGSTYSAQTASNNISRAVSASATLAQGGVSNSLNAIFVANSNQQSTVAVTGAPGAADNVVFHFLTSATQGIGTGGTNASASLWVIYVAAVGTNSSANYGVFTYGNGMSGAYPDPNAQLTANGVDLTLPFSAFASSNTLSYVFGATAQATNRGDQPGHTTLSSSITAALEGVDAVNATGGVIASASFNTDGTGSLDLTSTVPGPGSVVLLGTGLGGLTPFLRRRRRKFDHTSRRLL